MNRAVRTSLHLFVSMMLLTAIPLANASSSNVDQNTNRGHHSRLSNLAFWRGHEDHNRTGTHVAKAIHNDNGEHRGRLSKLAFWRHPKHTDTSLRTAQANHAAPKSIGVKTAQTTPTPHTSAAGKNSQKQAVHARGKAPAKTRPAATKAKPKQTA